MANIAANAIDWYLNRLNELHLVPTNMATFARDVSAKQLGDKDFVPRPLTVNNFTDAELDALYRLSYDKESGTYQPITYKSYGKVKPDFEYGAGDSRASEYLSPLRNVSTTLGSAGVRTDKDTGKTHIVDTYDFNNDHVLFARVPSGGIIGENGKVYSNIEEYKKDVVAERQRTSSKGASLYRILRQNAGVFGHNDRDPDKNKIKADISIDDIKERLGNKLGTFKITENTPKKDFVMRSALGGGAIAAPVGAGLGAIAGAIQLLRKDRRKKWLRTMLSHIAIGSLVAAAVGAAGGGYAAHKVHGVLDRGHGKPLEKGAGAPPSVARAEERRKKRTLWRTLVNLLSYGAPLAVLGGMVLPVANKARGIMHGITDAKADVRSTIEAKEIPEDEMQSLLMPEDPG